MTTRDRGELVEEYRAGIEAELCLLNQLAALADRQHDATASGDLGLFHTVSDARDALMRNLVILEEDLRQIRFALGEEGARADDAPGYSELADRHRSASAIIARILATDEQSMTALADAELARRSAVVSLEKGETTLAAYRRVLAPPLEHRLFDQRG